MKYNFVKLLQDGGLVRKYQTAAGGGIQQVAEKPYLLMTPEELATRKNDWQQTTTDQWLTNGLYDYEKMYLDYLQNKDAFDLSAITATPNFTGATRNSTGFREWNDLFNKSGLNKYFGYDASVADYYGPTTSARAGFLDYIKSKIPPTEPPKEEIPPVVTPGQGIPPGTSPNVDIQPKIELPEKPNPVPWTDWIPFSAIAGNSIATAMKNSALQAQMRFPKMVGPHEQAERTNAYHQRSLLQQNASEAIDRVNTNLGSVLGDDLKKVLAAYDMAYNMGALAELLKSDEYAKTKADVLGAKNRNLISDAKVANYNSLSDAAAWNNVLNAGIGAGEKIGSTVNDFIGKMATSYGEWVKDNRINDAAWERGVNEYTASLEQQALTNRHDALAYDFTKSLAYNNFVRALYGDTDEVFDSDKLTSADPGIKDAYIRSLWGGNSKLATSARDEYNKEVENSMRATLLSMQGLANKVAAKNLFQLPLISNLGIYRGYRPVQWQQRLFPASIELHKRGGSIRARFIDYMNHHLKAQLEQKRQAQKSAELSNKKLNAELERLSKEQLILLRSIFK